MKAIQDNGLNVPHDISVVGAGNVHYSDVLAIPLTTVDQGTAETGRCAAELLLEKIEAKGATKVRKILIQPTLDRARVDPAGVRVPQKLKLDDRSSCISAMVDTPAAVHSIPRFAIC